jgi:hypothetical protein
MNDQLLNVHGVFIRETKICIAEPLVPEPSSFEVKMTNGKMERYKPQGVD